MIDPDLHESPALRLLDPNKAFVILVPKTGSSTLTALLKMLSKRKGLDFVQRRLAEGESRSRQKSIDEQVRKYKYSKRILVKMLVELLIST